MKKILYIPYTYPYPANNGGTIAIASHIEELMKSKFADIIQYYFPVSNSNKNLKNIPNNFKISSCKISHYEWLIKIYYLLFSKYTYSYNIFTGKDFRNKVKNYDPDIIIADTMLSYKLIKDIKFNKCLIYIAHNIEYNYYKDLYYIEKNPFVKLRLFINTIKIKFIEKNICNQAKAIICISASDYNYFKNIYPNKVEFLPHKIEIQNDKWQGENEKSLFFCGPLHFAPNKDSVQWIAEKLAPILSKDIKIKIAGKGTDNVPNGWKKENIEYLGFVSKKELLDLYRNSSAFLCPIIYGSGVKIKVTEALGFGTPIIATKEALEGLDYIDIKPLINRNDLEKTKENIENLLNNKESLQQYSNNLIEQITQYQKDNNNSLEKIIGDCLND